MGSISRRIDASRMAREHHPRDEEALDGEGADGEHERVPTEWPSAMRSSGNAPRSAPCMATIRIGRPRRLEARRRGR